MWYYMFPDTSLVLDLPYYLHTIGMHELQPRTFRPEGSEYDQFFYCTKGSGVLIMNNQKYTVPAGDGFFVPAHIPHEYYPQSDIWDIRWMSPRGYALSDLYKKLKLKGGVYPLKNINALEMQINTMREELLNNKRYGIYYASAHVQKYILEFARQAGLLKEDTTFPLSDNLKTDTYEKHMNTIKDYVEFHFMENIGDKELCTLIDVTPQHLSRITRSCLGMRPIEYINHVRIHKAKEQLRYTRLNTCEISRLCGFENSNYFSRIFKKQTGLTPGEYRKQYPNIKKTVQ